MKKGLRHHLILLSVNLSCPALRPDEEGIKTSVNRSLPHLPRSPALRPDEEGIKTELLRINPHQLQSGLET